MAVGKVIIIIFVIFAPALALAFVKIISLAEFIGLQTVRTGLLPSPEDVVSLELDVRH